MELERVLFVIVLYQQSLKRCLAFQSLASLIQKHHKKISVFVYDNSPSPTDDLPGCCHYVHNASNAGVSRAYNEAFIFAKQNGFRFLLLMDQDSKFTPETFVSYSDAVATHPAVPVFAPIARDRKNIYSPFTMKGGRGKTAVLQPGIHSFTNYCIINSGMLVSVEAFERVRGYDERFPLDFSDIAFCERLATHNVNFCLIDGFIQHEHSSSQPFPSRSRFDMYLKAVVLFKHISNRNISYWTAGFPRALKLSAQFRDSWFLQRFFKTGV